MERHCIHTRKVYDWICQSTDLKLYQSLEHQIMKDNICGNIKLSGKETVDLWKASGDMAISGVISVCHRMGTGYMKVIVNDKLRFTLSQGEERTLTLPHLKSLEIKCLGGRNRICIGSYVITAQYNITNTNKRYKDCSLLCYLSDEDGNPVENITCREVIGSSGRRNIEVTLPNGETTFLQEVYLLKKGFITVQMVSEGVICRSCTIPFHTEEKLLLCAPNGTFLDCKILEFKCNASFTKDCECIEVALTIGQQVQVIADVVIDLEASLGTARP